MIPVDAVLLQSFGGPEGPDDVMPFLRNVTAGRNVPERRLAEVAQQYDLHGGISPINEQNRALGMALSDELAQRGLTPTMYWGNRNWHPFVADTLAQMAADDRRHACVVTTSAFSSYSGCRQYREDLHSAAASVPDAPLLTPVRRYFNHPGFVEALADRVRQAISDAQADERVHALFSAHSIPEVMAAGCDYQAQLADAAAAVSELAGLRGPCEVVYQSRSGPPSVPWLEPDVCDRIDQLAAHGVACVLVVPLGFVSDHMEVMYDLDTAAQQTAQRNGMTMLRARTVGCHRRFVAGLADLVEEAAGLRSDRPTLGRLGPRPDRCPADCCPAFSGDARQR